MDTDLEKDIHTGIQKLINLIDHFGDYSQNHEKYLNELSPDYEIFLAKRLTISEIHVIDCIGKNRLPNAKFVAAELGLTKGAISKINAKLLDKGFIKGNRLEDNKKEVYLTLTAQGKEIFEAHKKVHDIENGKIKAIFEQYKKDELGIINQFLDDLLNKL